jgi:sugar phosphate permease
MNLLSDINIHLENKKSSRLFFLFLWIMYAFVYMTKNCFSGALAAIVEEGSLTLTQATMINAAFCVAYAPLQILGGIFADKYSPEKLITIGLIGSAVSNVVIFFNQNFYVMLVSWVFSAIIQFALWPAVFKIISSQLVRSDRSKMVFYITFSASGGLILAYAVSAFVPDWRYNFAISAITLVLCATALLIICRFLNPIFVEDSNPIESNDKST